jgi:hypothetical protein
MKDYSAMDDGVADCSCHRRRMSQTFWPREGFPAGLDRRRAIVALWRAAQRKPRLWAGMDACRYAGRWPRGRQFNAHESTLVKADQGKNFENMPNNLNVEADRHLIRAEWVRTPDNAVARNGSVLGTKAITRTRRIRRHRRPGWAGAHATCSYSGIQVAAEHRKQR